MPMGSVCLTDRVQGQLPRAEFFRARQTAAGALGPTFASKDAPKRDKAIKDADPSVD
jgi:hypothetical protein